MRIAEIKNGTIIYRDATQEEIEEAERLEREEKKRDSFSTESIASVIDYNIMMGNLQDPSEEV